MKKLVLMSLVLPFTACAQQPTPVARPAMPKVDLSKPDATCGNVLYFDAGSWHDAPAWYTDKQGNVLAGCGGLSRGGRDICPPVAWTCAAPNVGEIMKRHQSR